MIVLSKETTLLVLFIFKLCFALDRFGRVKNKSLKYDFKIVCQLQWGLNDGGDKSKDRGIGAKTMSDALPTFI